MKKLGFLLIPIFILQQGCATTAVVAGSTASTVASDARTMSAIADDVSIDYHAHEALVADKTLNAEGHVVAVSYDCVLLLVGEVPTEVLRDRAESLVNNLPNVKKVINKITIEKPISLATKTNDTLLTTNVKARMFSTTNLKATHIKVITENSVVYLLGRVSREQGRVAAEVARNSTGVKKVVKVFEYLD